MSTEKATIYQVAQLGIQSVPDTAVAADKKLLSVSMPVNVQVESETNRAAGNKYNSAVSINKEWAIAPVSGKIDYREINYLLASLISSPTPVQQGVTTAYKRSFVSATSESDDGLLFTVEEGDANSAWRSKGMKTNGLELTFNRSGATLSGNMLGKAIETGITMTASPTELAPRLVMAGQLKFYIADAQANLTGATALTRGYEMVWRLNDKDMLNWPVGADPFVIESTPTLEATIKLAIDTIGIGLLATMRAGATKWFRIKAEGETIESTYKQTFQIDFPGQIQSVGEKGDQDGIYAVTYNVASIHDPAWGKAFQIDTITDLATL